MSQKRNNFLEDLRYDTSQKNNNKRNVKNYTTHHKAKIDSKNSKKLKELKRRLAIGAAALITAAGISTAVIHEIGERIEERDKYNSRDIQTEIENNGIETRPELYKVLSNTDLDEKLNKYYAEPNKENKNNVLKNINPQELAVYNFEMLKATIADGLGVSKDDIQIKYTRDELTIYTPNGNLNYWGKNGKENDNEIPSDYANLILRIAKDYQKTKSGNELESGATIEDNLELKKYITEHTFSLRDGTLVLIDEDGKIRKPSDAILRKIEFTEVKEDPER